MFVRLLVLASIMIFELTCGIAAMLAISSNWEYGGPDNFQITKMVMAVAAVLIAWLVTIAFFLRRSSRSKATRIIDNAKIESARILADAMDKAMALCSLDAGRCKQCGNPRTGKFCPKCGKESAGVSG